MSKDISKLPKWAQEHIKDLEAQVASRTSENRYWQEQLADLYANTPTRIFREEGLDGRTYVQADRMTFVLGKDKWGHEVKLRVILTNDNRIEVQASNGPITIEPAASNLVFIGMRDREFQK